MSYGQVNVTTNTIWYGSNMPPVGYENGVIVSANITLTILGITLDMNNMSNITLGVGSYLDLENATIQAAGGGANYWNGIGATGDALIEQYSTYPDPKTKNSNLAWQGILESTQTIVNMTNSHIINAKIGVESTTGAVVQTRGGSFKNCEVGVKINPYSSSTQPKVNACYFQGTTFKWDADFDPLNGVFQPVDLKGIWLGGVASVNVGGCIFTNSNTSAFCINERATGIYAQNSSFTAEYEGDEFCDDALCDSEPDAAQNCLASSVVKPCQFLNLSIGIDFNALLTGSGYNNNSLVSRYNTFTDNFCGIRNRKSNSMALYDNTFSTARAILNSRFKNIGCTGADAYYTGTVIHDVYTEDATQLRILDNTFTADKQYVEHLKIDKCGRSGDYSLIKKNTFTSTTSGYDDFDNVYGIILYNNNQGLDIVCNTFIDQGIDIWNTTTSTLDDQTSKSKAAMNTPSSNLANRFHIVNDGASFDYLVENGSAAVTAVYGGTNPPSLTATRDLTNCSVICLDGMDKLGIKERSDYNHFSIYPNPASNEFFISAKSINFEGYAQIVIMDIAGKVIYNQKLQLSSDQSIDISALSNGLYTAMLKNKDGHLIGHSKFSVQR
jgi:hypothetical protein